MEITENYLKEVCDLLATNYGHIVSDPMPHYPAMVGFHMATEYGEEFFVLGCNTDTGNWALEALDRGKEIVSFPNTENAFAEEIAEAFGEFLGGCYIKVCI